MPVTLERKPLFDALRLLRQVAPGRNTIPILSNVRLRTEGDTLQVTATDLDRWLTATIEVTDQDEPMDLTVQTARLSAFVSALPNGAEIRLTERPKTRRLDVAAGTARQQIATLPSEDWPTAKLDDLPEIEVEAPLLHRLLALPSTAVGVDETKPYLHGVHMVAREGGLSAVATDGHVLVHLPTGLPEALGACAALRTGITVPTGTVQLLAGMLAGQQTASMTLSDRLLCVSAGNLHLVSRLADSTFPDFRRILPARQDDPPTVDRAALLEAAKRCGISGDHVSSTGRSPGRSIHIAQEGAELVLSGRDDVGAAWERLPATGILPDSFGLNPAYLDRILHMATCERVEIHLIAADTAVRLVDPGDPAVDRIVMPVRTAAPQPDEAEA